MKKNLKSERKSLRIASETIRALDPQQLGRIAGGDTSFTLPPPNTRGGRSLCLMCYD